MDWQDRRKYYHPSADGRYTVSAARTPSGVVYTAWRVEQPVSRALGYRDSAQACRDLCEADAARTGVEPAAAKDRLAAAG